jgi:cholesterol transport system auxiliary component
MISELPRRLMLIVTACAAPLSDCSVLPNPPAPQIYRLSPIADAPPHTRVLHRRLVIDIPTASESLDTDRIALIRGRTRFDYYANSLWTDRVPLLMQTLMVDMFESNSGITEVGRDTQAVTPEYLLQTEIRRFEAVYTSAADQPPSAVIACEFRLIKMPDHRILAQTLLTNSAVASRNALDSVVEAFDIALGKMLVDCVEWTRNTIIRSA